MTVTNVGRVIVRLVLVLAAQSSCERVVAQDLPAEPDVYRTDNYRAPTPTTLTGARVASTTEVAAIWRRGEAVLVDVLPHAPRPANLPAETLWREKARLGIPGSFW